MEEFIRNNTWSFSFLIGLIFFISLASAFNNRSMSQVRDKTVPLLILVIELLFAD